MIIKDGIWLWEILFTGGNMKRYIYGGVIILAIIGFLGYGVWDGTRKANQREQRIRSGELIRIDGIMYSVQKKTLINGKCYYIYSGSRQTFTIPCEEKE